MSASSSKSASDLIIRSASHSGSWYSSDPIKLEQELSSFINSAQKMSSIEAAPVRALIGPHAGFRFSGPTAAFAYMNIDTSNIRRVFILGPSHRHSTRKCLLSSAHELETPIGNLPVDQQVISQLLQHSEFDLMSLDVDETEHSIEMHLPFVAHVFKRNTVTVIPIMVGGISDKTKASCGNLLAPFLDDPQNFFVVSSDFCHFGERFNYTFYDKSKGEVWQSIQMLDRLGMDAIESLSPETFNDYLDQYQNTICGRHPIGVLLHTIHHSKFKYQIKFNHYAQSSQCKAVSDSSVSYASGVLVQQNSEK